MDAPFGQPKQAATSQALRAALVGLGLLTLAALAADASCAVALPLAVLIYGPGSAAQPAVALGLLVARPQPAVKGVRALVPAARVRRLRRGPPPTVDRPSSPYYPRHRDPMRT